MALARTLLLPALAAATSFKMDFLSSGTVRTDPLAFSQARCSFVDLYITIRSNFTESIRPLNYIITRLGSA